MDYFDRLRELLTIEKKVDQLTYQTLTETASVQTRRQNGITWYPIVIRDTEIGKGDYLSITIERTNGIEISHQFRFGMPVAVFSNHDPSHHRIEGLITHLHNHEMIISLRVDDLPDWTRDGKLGVDLLFDDNSYDEMFAALKSAAAEAGKNRLIKVLTAQVPPEFHNAPTPAHPALNAAQQAALQKILGAQDLVIVHGPPGTGKTTTLISAIEALTQRSPEQILVTAPSNTAVDLLTEKLAARGIRVVRIGNPVRVSETLQELTLESQVAAHPQVKQVRALKKQANEFRHMAQKYKRNFGKAEREQRKALFDEARKIMKEVGKVEQYIQEDELQKAQVITATLVGANHYSVSGRRYQAVVIDEAGQSSEPACWIPILKAPTLILAGDHCQLPPTVKSPEAAKGGLSTTLLEKMVEAWPDAMIMLEEQYRMHELIMGYSSAVFYRNKLRAATTVANHLLPGDTEPFLFIDTAGCGFEEKQEDTSIINEEEAAFVLKQVTRIVNAMSASGEVSSFPGIGLISPYKQQVEILKTRIRDLPEWPSLNRHITLHTVDGFQGQEREIMIISLVRSNTDGNIGFLSDIRRMNVAMTRARKKLLIVGDSATLSGSPFYAGLIEYAQQHNAYKSAWEFMGD
jgi:ATP-dependent RNA/DNA helicase IGHMBP2